MIKIIEVEYLIEMESDTVKSLKVAAYTIPTDSPESDGTIKWDSTTIVLVETEAAGEKGIGYTYASSSAAHFIHTKLKDIILNEDALQTQKIWQKMLHSIRNDGAFGIAMMALSAIDNSLWDLRAKILQQPLCITLGMVRKNAPVYGSGGFTSYSKDQLQQQLGGWAQDGFTAVKMKIGREPEKDIERIKSAREAIGSTKLFVDANGAYNARQAIEQAHLFKEYHVSWYEEPVPSSDLQGLHYIKNNTPAEVKIAAGEYGYDATYFKNMLQAKSVDVLQADATRCGGITGFLKAAVLAEAYNIPFSFHCAPYQHLHAALAATQFFIGEYFYDHARIENMLFDGVPQPVNGALQADLSRPGVGLEFKYADAEKYKV